eukprot:3178412-Rhodomonas_salina.1
MSVPALVAVYARVSTSTSSTIRHIAYRPASVLHRSDPLGRGSQPGSNRVYVSTGHRVCVRRTVGRGVVLCIGTLPRQYRALALGPGSTIRARQYHNLWKLCTGSPGQYWDTPDCTRDPTRGLSSPPLPCPSCPIARHRLRQYRTSRRTLADKPASVHMDPRRRCTWSVAVLSSFFITFWKKLVVAHALSVLAIAYRAWYQTPMFLPQDPTQAFQYHVPHAVQPDTTTRRPQQHDASQKRAHEPDSSPTQPALKPSNPHTLQP